MGDVDLFDAWTVLDVVFPTDADGTIRLSEKTNARRSPYGNYAFEWRRSELGGLLVNAADRRGADEIRFGVALYGDSPRGGRRRPHGVPAVWLRRVSPDLDATPLSDAPPSLTIADVDAREAYYGWLLTDALDPATYDDLVRALATLAGDGFEPVFADGFVRLPDCGNHQKPFAVLVRLHAINHRRYDSAELSLTCGVLNAEFEWVQPPDSGPLDLGQVDESDAALRPRDAQASHDGVDGDETDAAHGHPRMSEALVLAEQRDILALMRTEVRRAGFAGDTTIPEIVLLVGTSRLLANPVSIVVRSPSSAGKSFSVEAGLKFLPESAFYELTSMSPLAIYYTQQSLEHRILFVSEAAGIGSEEMAYALRSLLSSGHLRREVTDFEHGTTRLLETDGPTGGIFTTTRSVDRELDTRVLTFGVPDTEELTREVLGVLAADAAGRLSNDADYEIFQLLQIHLAELNLDVVVPFAPQLAELVIPQAVRMRRDFSSLLGLIKAHALLHQATRQRDAHGRVEAQIADYAAVHRLANASIAEGVESSVSSETRQTVQAVRSLLEQGTRPVTIAQLANALERERSAVSRRVNRAIRDGYLIDATTRRGARKELTLGDPLPEDRHALPTPNELDDVCRRACTPRIEQL